LASSLFVFISSEDAIKKPADITLPFENEIKQIEDCEGFVKQADTPFSDPHIIKIG
jgi:hypothetical protein